MNTKASDQKFVTENRARLKVLVRPILGRIQDALDVEDFRELLNALHELESEIRLTYSTAAELRLRTGVWDTPALPPRASAPEREA